jgi:hypothetical protein
MATATASVHANQAPPRLRLVHRRLDLESLCTEWQVSLDAAERGIAASAPLLKAQEVAVRRERLRIERLAVAAELRCFARVTRAWGPTCPKVEPGAPGGVAAVRTPGSVSTTTPRATPSDPNRSTCGGSDDPGFGVRPRQARVCIS